LLLEEEKIEILSFESSSRSSSTSSESINDVEDDLIGIPNMINMEPEFINLEPSFIKGTPFNISELMNRGHPSVYVIMGSYIEEYQIRRLKVSEKLAVLVKLKTLYEDKDKLTDYEKIVTIKLSLELLSTLNRFNFTAVEKSWVIKFIEGSFELRHLHQGSISEDIREQLIAVGSFIEVRKDDKTKENVFVPLPISRVRQWVSTLSKESELLETFVNLLPIKEAYARLYKSPYQSENELLDLLTQL